MRSLPYQLALPVLALPRFAKRLVALSLDISLCILAVWLAYYLRLGDFVPLNGRALWAVGASVALAIPIFIVSGLYRAIFRYSGWPALLTVARAVAIYNPGPTSHPRIMKAHEDFIPWAELEEKLKALEMALNVNDVPVIRAMMKELVTGYTPNEDIVDWVYLARGTQ